VVTFPAWDTCDECWGTGDANKKGTDINKLEAEQKEWAEKECLECLAERLGCNFPTMKETIKELAKLAEKQGKRKRLSAVKAISWNSLAEILYNLVKQK
jgi:hypothetical protein